MIFSPTSNELQIINSIQNIHNSNYSLIRMTPTMIGKNNIDANRLFRALLYDAGIVDYEKLKLGGANGIVTQATLILPDQAPKVRMNFYLTNKRGDRRFSIGQIEKRMKDGIINEGDLLYISTNPKDNKSNIFIINLTSNTPSKDRIVDVIGLDPISKRLMEIQSKLKSIVEMGWVDNVKGKGPKAPKDIGDTLEALLGIETNNDSRADISGEIEVKSKGESKTMDTLFTLRPSFEGTEISEIEENDKHRVSAFTRYYGYKSEKHPDCQSLYITIGSENAPQNNQGFYLDVDDDAELVKLMLNDPLTRKAKMVAYWTFSDLKKQLEEKHPSTLWFKAHERTVDGMEQFSYHEIEFSRAPQFMTFLTLIKLGTITYDWRGYVSSTGKYAGKNHGNAWRIKPHAKKDLFGQFSKIETDSII